MRSGPKKKQINGWIGSENSEGIKGTATKSKKKKNTKNQTNLTNSQARGAGRVGKKRVKDRGTDRQRIHRTLSVCLENLDEVGRCDIFAGKLEGSPAAVSTTCSL